MKAALLKKEELLEFLIDAKRETFASGKKAEIGNDGSRTFQFSIGPFSYVDTYYGTLVDCGQELVSHGGLPIWGMAYRGGMILDTIDSKECFKFLKHCLQEPKAEFPVRGPDLRSMEEWTYKNEYNGNIEHFTGHESIEVGGRKV